MAEVIEIIEAPPTVAIIVVPGWCLLALLQILPWANSRHVRPPLLFHSCLLHG
jgi:hypothetical protein